MRKVVFWLCLSPKENKQKQGQYTVIYYACFNKLGTGNSINHFHLYDPHGKPLQYSLMIATNRSLHKQVFLKQTRISFYFLVVGLCQVMPWSELLLQKSPKKYQQSLLIISVVNHINSVDNLIPENRCKTRILRSKTFYLPIKHYQNRSSKKRQTMLCHTVPALVLPHRRPHLPLALWQQRSEVHSCSLK